MDNNEKAAYFAQYWGQNVLICTYQNTHNVKEVNGAYMLVNQPDEHLLLTPLSAITDEDAIEVGKILFGEKYSNGKCYSPENGESYYITVHIPETTINQSVELYFDGHLRNMNGYGLQNVLQVYDYLRSKGYATPFRNYSVEQLIEMGWLKLRS